MCGQTEVYEHNASISSARCVCQRRIDIDGSKLDGDGVCPVRGLIIMAEILLIIPLSLPLLLLACLSMSLPALFQRPKADERSPLWHMTDTPFCLLSFFHFIDPLHHTTPHHHLPSLTHPPTCMHAHPHTLPLCLLHSIPLSLQN